MTSEVDAMKTNEFLRRRKLRIQQVREQSKEIAKKLRLRAKAEKTRRSEELESNKSREFLKQQHKFVHCLEQFCANSLQNVGTSHKTAEGLKLQDIKLPEDNSQKRGKEAALEVKRKKQEQLDIQKKILDRKLQAREAANEISREKSSLTANKVLAKISAANDSKEDTNNQITASQNKPTDKVDDEEKPNSLTCDMASQWTSEPMPQEWEPHIPVLSLPKDYIESPKKTPAKNAEKVNVQSDRKKRPNLFAISDEMPSSLRGGHKNNTNDTSGSNKPSLTLVSEYLQNRELRLREPDDFNFVRRNLELQQIKNTLMKTRASTEGSFCQVADVQVIPVPSWRMENRAENCGFCSHLTSCHKGNISRASSLSRSYKDAHSKTFTDTQVKNKIAPTRYLQYDVNPNPVLRGPSPFKRCKVAPKCFPAKHGVNNKEKPINTDCCALQKKSSVTMYDHATRDTKDIPCGDKKLVTRDPCDPDADENAYSLAVKETTSTMKEKETKKKVRDARHKVAMSKQSVEKEYKDTMAFLNSLPKDNSKPIKIAYKDEHRQQQQKECWQKALQQEYKKVERDCKKHTQAKCKTPSKEKYKMQDIDENMSKDFQYSWMPVPDSDSSFAIHTIPTTLKENKSGNTVKFSQVDNYHEYRSRHKHTPPTKDTPAFAKPKRVSNPHESMKDDQSSDSSSDESSVEDFRLEKHTGKINRVKALSDAERIVIYKILESKNDKSRKVKQSKDSSIGRPLSSDDAIQTNAKKSSSKKIKESVENSFEHLNEGVYKAIPNGMKYNIMSCYSTNVELWQTAANHKPWWENVTALYFPPEEMNNVHAPRKSSNVQCGGQSTSYIKITKKSTHLDAGAGTSKDIKEDHTMEQPSEKKREMMEDRCACTDALKLKCVETNTCSCTSASSFKTASNDRLAVNPDTGFIKLLDEAGKDAGKFYIGATGFLKDDNYEVIIQLRKKDTDKQESRPKSAEIPTEQPVEKSMLVTDENEVKSVAATELNSEVKTVPVIDQAPLMEIAPVTDLLSEPSKKNSEIMSKTNCQSSSCADAASNITYIEAEQQVVIPDPVKPQRVDNAVNVSNPSIRLKADPEIKIAMSTCTQTSFDSPAQRPMFIHMSSTTSTAYMSPPEFILPEFLKHDHVLNTNEIIGEEYTVKDALVGEDEVLPREKLPCAYKKCKTALPKFRRASENRNTDLDYRCKKKTSRQCRKVQHDDRSPKRISQVNACEFSSKFSRSKEPIEKYKTTLFQNKNTLDPIVKWYVDKLLNLNKDGLTAINVANQDCSAVTTPGSSIVGMPNNHDPREPIIKNTISLEQLKEAITKQVLEKYKRELRDNTETTFSSNKRKIPRSPTKRKMHKIKSFYVSKHLIKLQSNNNKKLTEFKSETCDSKSPPSASPLKTDSSKESACDRKSVLRSRSKSSPSPRKLKDNALNRRNKSTELLSSAEALKSNEHFAMETWLLQYQNEVEKIANKKPKTLEAPSILQNQRHSGTSTQTCKQFDEDIHFIKMAENKLQNMEKIADLTEICTKRLSNLAKVLEEVRRNKSIVYNHASSSGSETDRNSVSSEKISISIYEPVVEIKKLKKPSPASKNQLPDDEKFIPFLNDIPKPVASKPSDSGDAETVPELKLPLNGNPNAEVPNNNKGKGKPPPALTRRNLKHVQEVVPHELSTVLEVETPLSANVKNNSIRNNTSANALADAVPSNIDDELKTNEFTSNTSQSNVFQSSQTDKIQHQNDPGKNPDELQRKVDDLPLASDSVNKIGKKIGRETSKTQFMDINQFNNIALKPFISIHEYAKQCNVGSLEEGSNLDDVHRDEALNDDLSSLHSDGSLPDVIAELLKRNIISEPFKFDANSTTVSSDSTLSVLALSKVRKEKNKGRTGFQNKENVAETSDTLSFSSNPDLENAFKKLGIGWASSTLKKTKERLALSSSSNTSSSSLSQFKLKVKNNNGHPSRPVTTETPPIVTDTVVLVNSIQRQPLQGLAVADSGKNAEQQTSKTMTVKQFLTNELSKKITFTNKSTTDDTKEFVSLYETKLPEDMKRPTNLTRASAGDKEFASLYETKLPEDLKRVATLTLAGDRSMDSAPSGGNNRARTSTPVQIYKSMTYHSSSSSNVSNGLFSNADLSSVKGTSNSQRNHSTSEKDELTIPNCSLKKKKGFHSDFSE